MKGKILNVIHKKLQEDPCIIGGASCTYEQKRFDSDAQTTQHTDEKLWMD